mmetsp:Transcript_73690/g.216251  ORF Transcript_73690/g.216251 Transcript_73690/m.216251 type:complete len:246 (-) Transcript_73690:13-750(-)
MLGSVFRGARCRLHLGSGANCRQVLPSLTSSGGFSAARCCASQQQQQQQQGPPIRVVERSLSDFIDVVILPLRHTVYAVNLWSLRFAFPGSWNASEFHAGAPQAFRHVTEHLEDRDVRPLNGVVSDELINDLRTEATTAAESGHDPRANFQAVVDARLMGIFTVRVRTDEMGDAAVFVTGLLAAVEEYAPSTASSANAGRPWHVRRIHKWTFKRQLPSEDGEEPGDWQVVAMNKRRWQPPANMDA